MKETDFIEINKLNNAAGRKYYMEDLESIPGFLNSSADLYGFDNEKLEDIQMIQANMASERMEKYTPKAKDRTPDNVKHICTESMHVVHTVLPEAGTKYYMDSINKTKGYFDDIEKRYTDPDSMQRRTVAILRKQMNLLVDEPDYLDAVEATEVNYIGTFNSVFMFKALFLQQLCGMSTLKTEYPFKDRTGF